MIVNEKPVLYKSVIYIRKEPIFTLEGSVWGWSNTTYTIKRVTHIGGGKE